MATAADACLRVSVWSLQRLVVTPWCGVLPPWRWAEALLSLQLLSAATMMECQPHRSPPKGPCAAVLPSSVCFVSFCFSLVFHCIRPSLHRQAIAANHWEPLSILLWCCAVYSVFNKIEETCSSQHALLPGSTWVQRSLPLRNAECHFQHNYGRCSACHNSCNSWPCSPSSDHSHWSL